MQVSRILFRAGVAVAVVAFIFGLSATGISNSYQGSGAIALALVSIAFLLASKVNPL